MALMTSLLAGLLFGLGLAISGMIDPARVTGFLDVAGAWDPSLAFVMGGALAVFMPGYFLLVKPRRQSLLGEPMARVPAPVLDRRLIGGAALFGIDTPVGVGSAKQPILQVTAVNQLQRPQFARLDSCACFTHHGMKSIDEWHSGHDTLGTCQRP